MLNILTASAAEGGADEVGAGGGVTGAGAASGAAISFVAGDSVFCSGFGVFVSAFCRLF